MSSAYAKVQCIHQADELRYNHKLFFLYFTTHFSLSARTTARTRTRTPRSQAFRTLPTRVMLVGMLLQVVNLLARMTKRTQRLQQSATKEQHCTKRKMLTCRCSATLRAMVGCSTPSVTKRGLNTPSVTFRVLHSAATAC